MSNIIHVVGHNGKRYETLEEAMNDWNNGSTFKVVGRSTITREEWEDRLQDYEVLLNESINWVLEKGVVNDR